MFFFKNPFPIFQSTLPMRGATRMSRTKAVTCRNFNPHSPCGERPKYRRQAVVLLQFQSTLPMRGATFCRNIFLTPTTPFQSTLPMRGATTFLLLPCFLHAISIHTPHAGSDSYQQKQTLLFSHFNPHSPCGERLHPIPNGLLFFGISIHTPHAGSDGF